MAKYAKFFSVGGGAGPNGLQLPLGTVLDATLRQVQDGTGTGSPLYLSTGSVRIGTTAASAMYWDNTNNRLGIGTSAPSAPLEIRGITNSSIVLRVGGLTPGRDFIFNPYYATNTYGGFFSNESGNITLGASLGTDNGSGIGIILGAPAGTRTALLHLKGTGSTSATTSLLVQNSSGALSFKCTDDLVQQFNGYQTSFTHPTYTGSLLIFSAGNNQQTIRGGNGENIVFGAGGNTMNLNATEVYVSSSFLGSNFWIQPNGSFCLGQQAAANASALLDMRSTTKGFLPPRVTTAQKNAIASPATGLMIFDTDLARPCFFNGATWITL